MGINRLHALSDEFPNHKEQIRELEHSDAHFRKLAEAYDVVNHKILKFESGIDTTSDFHLEDLKKERLVLLDQIQHILTHPQD